MTDEFSKELRANADEIDVPAAREAAGNDERLKDALRNAGVNVDGPMEMKMGMGNENYGEQYDMKRSEKDY